MNFEYKHEKIADLHFEYKNDKLYVRAKKRLGLNPYKLGEQIYKRIKKL